MWKNEYKSPRYRSSDFDTPVIFYEYEEQSGPLPGQKEKKVLFKCLAKIEGIWLKDLERAKQNGTLSEATIIIRNPIGTYTPTNKHFLSVEVGIYQNDRYNIKHVQPDVKDPDFINIVAAVST
ncbi:phage head-tail adapter protein [Virgibacillus halophilus]|uniref:Phage head-tail adapter protein n=1 Tax=Tigheibacillus halophilus TaxID=361280 RepID=A0ABU5CBZ5_9BACI|nr:phage head-tail adapter protein [Virgibacillus halophilus]